MSAGFDVFGLGQCCVDIVGQADRYPTADAKCELTGLSVDGGGPGQLEAGRPGRDSLAHRLARLGASPRPRGLRVLWFTGPGPTMPGAARRGLFGTASIGHNRWSLHSRERPDS